MAHLRKTVPVSGKNDSFCPNSILLLPDRPTTFGRIISPDTNVRLLSKATPLMISRRHATVSVSTGKWTVTDHEVNKEALFLSETLISLWYFYSETQLNVVFLSWCLCAFFFLGLHLSTVFAVVERESFPRLLLVFFSLMNIQWVWKDAAGWITLKLPP